MDSLMKSAMDSKFLVSKPKYFTLKKWTLVTVMCTNVLFLVGAFFFREKLVEFFMSKLKHLKPEEEEPVKDALQVSLPVVIIISIIMELVFLTGVIRHNICICTTYYVFIIIGALLSIFQAFMYPIFWINFIFATIIAIIAIMYVRDLKFIRTYMHGRKRLHQEA